MEKVKGERTPTRPDLRGSVVRVAILGKDADQVDMSQR
jgi:hypothetical protein